jgi:anti-anti-sigma factor
MEVRHGSIQPFEGRAALATESRACDYLPSAPFAVTVRLEADRAVVMLRGELDLMSVDILADCFAGIAPPVEELVLDFAELDFIECSGLNAIIAATRQAAVHGGRLRIRSPRPQSRRLLDLVNFEQIVAIAP